MLVRVALSTFFIFEWNPLNIRLVMRSGKLYSASSSLQDKDDTAAKDGKQKSHFGVVLTPDGQALVLASADKTIRVWSVQTDSAPLDQTLAQGHSDDVRAVAFAPSVGQLGRDDQGAGVVKSRGHPRLTEMGRRV